MQLLAKGWVHMFARSWQKELGTGDPRELCQVILGRSPAAFLCHRLIYEMDTVIPASSASEPARGGEGGGGQGGQRSLT